MWKIATSHKALLHTSSYNSTDPNTNTKLVVIFNIDYVCLVLPWYKLILVKSEFTIKWITFGYVHVSELKNRFERKIYVCRKATNPSF